jgi:hypothetical protein
MTGYHLKTIEKGTFGEFSKIREEFEELEEALDQGVMIMALVEASDLIGAIEAWAVSNGSSLEELIKMKTVTHRAFESGSRTPKKECECGVDCKCNDTRRPQTFTEWNETLDDIISPDTRQTPPAR